MILDNNLRLGSVTLTATGTYDFPDVVDLRNNTAYTATASGSLYTVAQGNQNVELSEGTTLFRSCRGEGCYQESLCVLSALPIR